MPDVAADSRLNNAYATASFWLGIASIIFYQIGIIPLLAIVFGVIGLSTFKEAVHKNKWMTFTGLALGVVYLIMSASFWAQAGVRPSEYLEGKRSPVQSPRPAQDPNVPFRLHRQKRY